MKKVLSQISILAYYQIIGGLVGLGITANAFIETPVFSLYNIIVILIVSALFAFSIFTGIILLKKRYIKGLNFSIINNALQIIGFRLFGFGFLYVSGAYFAISLDLTDDTFLGINFWISHWELFYRGDPNSIFLIFNIIAILIVSFIYKLKASVIKLGDRINGVQQWL